MAAISRRSFCVLRAAAAFALLVLTACGSEPGQWIPPGLGLNRLMAVPRPFKQDKTIGPASAANAGSDVTLTGISGLPDGDAARLTAAVSRAAEPSDILVESHLTDRRTSLLEGAAIFAPEGAGRRVTLNFNWRRPDGLLGRRFQVDALDPNRDSAIDDATIATLGRSTAMELAAAMGVAPVAPAAPIAALAGAPTILIEPVKGAPGDGNRALSRAMSVELATDGVDLTTDKKRARFVLAGTVAVAPTPEGSEIVQITWRILSATGAELAKVEQSNAIEKGSLNRLWGDTAYDVANAAADGLLDALQKLTAPPSESSTGSPVPSIAPR